MDAKTRKARRVVIVAVLGLGLALAGLVVYIVRDMATARAISYRETHILPEPAEVCPGDAFTFPVSIAIETPETVARVTEGWCRAEDGICPAALQQEPVYINFIEPYTVQAQARRTAPENMAPGAWQLRHCNEAHSSGKISVVCYQVEVVVLDCP